MWIDASGFLGLCQNAKIMLVSHSSLRKMGREIWYYLVGGKSKEVGQCGHLQLLIIILFWHSLLNLYWVIIVFWTSIAICAVWCRENICLKPTNPKLDIQRALLSTLRPFKPLYSLCVVCSTVCSIMNHRIASVYAWMLQLLHLFDSSQTALRRRGSRESFKDKKSMSQVRESHQFAPLYSHQPPFSLINHVKDLICDPVH